MLRTDVPRTFSTGQEEGSLTVLREQVVVELMSEPQGLEGVSHEERIAILDRAAACAKRVFLDAVEALRQREPAIEIEVSAVEGIFPVLELTASPAAIRELSRHPLVKAVSASPRFRRASGR
jgi:hypothetical protein